MEYWMLDNIQVLKWKIKFRQCTRFEHLIIPILNCLKLLLEMGWKVLQHRKLKFRTIPRFAGSMAWELFTSPGSSRNIKIPRRSDFSPRKQCSCHPWNPEGLVCVVPRSRAALFSFAGEDVRATFSRDVSPACDITRLRDWAISPAAHS